MKKLLCLLSIVTAFSGLHAATDDPSTPTYVSFLNGVAWGPSYWQQVRATCYPNGGKSKTGTKVQYASPQQVGTAAIPSWIAAGSLIRIWSKNTNLVYIAADTGSAVNSRKAAKKTKDPVLKKEYVIDFCAPKEGWSERMNVEIFPYAYKTPFKDLKPDEKKWIIQFAQKLIGKGHKPK
jgi:3D (Asp-Asp-Asp) domain-containing protein